MKFSRPTNVVRNLFAAPHCFFNGGGAAKSYLFTKKNRDGELTTKAKNIEMVLKFTISTTTSHAIFFVANPTPLLQQFRTDF